MDHSNGNLKKILIVDDDTDFTSVLEARLKQRGYEVAVSNGGKEAVGQARLFHPDLILLDLEIPDLPGDITAFRIKSENGSRAIPMIALTGHGDPLARATTRAFGFVDHVTKPYEPEDLFNRIEKHLADRSALLHKENTDEKTEEDFDR